MTSGFATPVQSSQVVAIQGVDPASNTATGYTRRRTTIDIDLSYHVGAIQVTPSFGEQWFVKQVNTVKGTAWVLDSKIPFNSAEVLTPATEGQVQIGNGNGPVQLHGTQVNANAPLRLTSGNSPLPAASTVDQGSLAFDDTAVVPTYSNGTDWVNLATSTEVASKYVLPTGGIPPADLTAAAQAALTAAQSAYQKPPDGIAPTDLSSTAQAALTAGSGASTDLATLMSDLGVSNISGVVSAIQAGGAGGTATADWNALLAALGLTPGSGTGGNGNAVATWLAQVQQDANNAWTQFINLFTTTGQSSNTFNTWLSDLETGATNAWTAIFGSPAPPSPTSTILQSAVQNLETDLSNAWTALFGSSSTPGTNAQVLQSSIQDLENDLSNAWTAIFGSSTTPSSTAQIPQTSIEDLETDLANAITTGDWTPLLQALFGSTSNPTSTSKVQQSSINGLTALWTAIFGTPTPSPTSTILQSAVHNLQTDLSNAWTALFGSATTPGSNALVLQSSIQNLGTDLSNAWTAIFGSSTTPATTAKIPQTSIQDLVTDLGDAITTGDWAPLLNALFGSGTIGSTIQTSAVPSGISPTKLTNIFGGATLGQDLTNLANALFGVTTVTGTSKVAPTSVANVLGGANLGADLTSVSGTTTTHGNWFTQLMSVLGISTGGSSGTSIGTAITTAQSTASTSATNLTNTWSWLFGTTTPTSSTPVQTAKVANLFGGANLGTDLTNLANALFGGTSVTSTSKVAPTSVASTLGGSSLGADVSTVNTTATTHDNWFTQLMAALGISTGSTSGTSIGSAISGAQSSATSVSTNLNNTWSWLFGTTTPTSSTPVQAAKVANVLGNGSLGADLAALGTALFGSATVNSTITTAAVPTGIPATKLTNLFGGTNLSADLTNLVNSLFGGSTIQSAITTTAVPSGISATKIANVLGGSNLGADLTSVNGTVSGHTTSIATNATNVTNTWSWLFGTTTPTGTTPVQTNKIANIFGGSNLSADLTNLATALFGGTSVSSTSKVNAASITAALNQGSLAADIQALAQLFFGSNTVGSSVQATALPSTLQTVNTNWSSLLTNLFTGGTISSAIQQTAVPTGIPATKVSNVLGGSTLGQDLTNLSSWLFNTTAPTSTTQVQSTVLPGVQGIVNLGTTMQNTWDSISTAIVAALGLDSVPSTGNPLSTVQDVLSQHATQTSAALAQSGMNANSVAVVNNALAQPLLSAPGPTQVAASSPLYTVTSVQPTTGTGVSNGMVSFLQFHQDTKVDSFTILVNLASAGAPTGFYCNLYTVNPSTGLLTQVYGSPNLVSNVAAFVSGGLSKLSWLSVAFPSELSFSAGAVVAMDFVVVSSNTTGVQLGYAPVSLPPRPGSTYPLFYAAQRTSVSTPQPSTIAWSGLTTNTEMVWFGLNGPGEVYQYPVLRKITASGTVVAPSWARFADVIPLGGGSSGGGGIGFPGNPGGSTIVSQGAHSVTAVGGTSGTNGTSFSSVDAIGIGAATETYTPPGATSADSFPGSTNVATKQTGSSPGGGGGGGNNNAGAYGYGGACGQWNPTTWTISGGETFTVTVGAGGTAPVGQSVGAANGAAGLAYIVFRAS